MNKSIPISSIQKKHKKEFKQLFSLIKQYNRIAIFRHMRPDYDALGSQFGFLNFIKDNFPDKEVIALGDNHALFSSTLFPETNKVNEIWFKDNFLAIIVDAANTPRIADPRYKHADKIIKIDHHPNIEPFGDINIVNTDLVSASELIANFFIFTKRNISALTAKYLYMGIVGDSGRFQYDKTSAHTFDIASILVSTGFPLSKVTQDMYVKPIEDLSIIKLVLNRYKLSEKKVAYYILKNQDLIDNNLTVERGKDYLFLFNNIKEIPIWFSVTEDVSEPCYRISLRSKQINIDKISEKYGGGGHPLASGAKIKDLKELDNFIKDLDNLIK